MKLAVSAIEATRSAQVQMILPAHNARWAERWFFHMMTNPVLFVAGDPGRTRSRPRA
jgi:hypothetical protein